MHHGGDAPRAAQIRARRSLVRGDRRSAGAAVGTRLTPHYKYSLAHVVAGRCVLRYDNEAGKGDHKHVDGLEEPYQFASLATLFDDFFAEVDRREAG